MCLEGSRRSSAIEWLQNRRFYLQVSLCIEVGSHGIIHFGTVLKDFPYFRIHYEINVALTIALFGICKGIMHYTFSIYFYDLSQKIAAKKVEDIKSTSADIVVTDCPGCQVQLIDSLTRRGVPVQVRHIMELLE